MKESPLHDPRLLEAYQKLLCKLTAGSLSLMRKDKSEKPGSEVVVNGLFAKKQAQGSNTYLVRGSGT